MRIGKSFITNPTEVAEKLTLYFTSNVEEVVKQKNNIGNCNNLQHKISHCSNTTLIHPVTEEVESLTQSLKVRHSAGYGDIPECLVKQRIQLVKISPTHIYNVSLNSGVFPNECKIVKVKPLYKNRNRYDVQNYRPISVLSIFLNYWKG